MIENLWHRAEPLGTRLCGLSGKLAKRDDASQCKRKIGYLLTEVSFNVDTMPPILRRKIMTDEEFVIKTASYFAEDSNRKAVDERGLCLYLTKDGKRCVVGVWCDRDELNQIADKKLQDESYSALLEAHIHIKALEGVSLGAIEAMQNWHDNSLGEPGERSALKQVIHYYLDVKDTEQMVEAIYKIARQGKVAVPVEV